MWAPPSFHGPHDAKAALASSSACASILTTFVRDYILGYFWIDKAAAVDTTLDRYKYSVFFLLEYMGLP